MLRRDRCEGLREPRSGTSNGLIKVVFLVRGVTLVSSLSNHGGPVCLGILAGVVKVGDVFAESCGNLRTFALNATQIDLQAKFSIDDTIESCQGFVPWCRHDVDNRFTTAIPDERRCFLHEQAIDDVSSA